MLGRLFVRNRAQVTSNGDEAATKNSGDTAVLPTSLGAMALNGEDAACDPRGYANSETTDSNRSSSCSFDDSLRTPEVGGATACSSDAEPRLGSFDDSLSRCTTLRPTRTYRYMCEL